MSLHVCKQISGAKMKETFLKAGSFDEVRGHSQANEV